MLRGRCSFSSDIGLEEDFFFFFEVKWPWDDKGSGF
jgi:hypothetical protein